jgi:hypothetical protein
VFETLKGAGVDPAEAAMVAGLPPMIMADQQPVPAMEVA